jgi:hypothetical protein
MSRRRRVYQDVSATVVDGGGGGWSTWINPRQWSYRLSCCDCGLVHEFQFRVTDPNGNVIEATDFDAEYRVRRDNRTTGAMRRHGHGTLRVRLLGLLKRAAPQGISSELLCVMIAKRTVAMAPEEWERFREECLAKRRPSIDGRILPARDPDDAEGDDP